LSGAFENFSGKDGSAPLETIGPYAYVWDYLQILGSRLPQSITSVYSVQRRDCGKWRF